VMRFKRILGFGLAVCLVASLCGCGASEGGSGAKGASVSVSAEDFGGLSPTGVVDSWATLHSELGESARQGVFDYTSALVSHGVSDEAQKVIDGLSTEGRSALDTAEGRVELAGLFGYESSLDYYVMPAIELGDGRYCVAVVPQRSEDNIGCVGFFDSEGELYDFWVLSGTGGTVMENIVGVRGSRSAGYCLGVLRSYISVMYSSVGNKQDALDACMNVPVNAVNTLLPSASGDIEFICSETSCDGEFCEAIYSVGNQYGFAWYVNGSDSVYLGVYGGFY